MGFVTQSARFYCRPVRDYSWARYFFVSVDHFVACYRRYSPVRSTTIIQDLLCSLYCLCRHNVFRYCKVKCSGQNYAELALRGIRWFVVRRLMLRYYTPPLLSRFPIIRLYCYSFPSSFYSNLFGRADWKAVSVYLWIFSGARIFTSLLQESWWPAWTKRSRKTFYHFWIFIFRECWWCIISFFSETDYRVYDSHTNLYIVL